MGHGTQGNSIFSDNIDFKDDDEEIETKDCDECSATGIAYIGSNDDLEDVYGRCPKCEGKGEITTQN